MASNGAGTKRPSAKNKNKKIRFTKRFSWRSAVVFMAVFAILGGLFIARSFANPTDKGPLFTCGPKAAKVDAPPDTIPTSPDGQAVPQAQSDAPVCPAGQVPHPKPTTGLKYAGKGMADEHNPHGGATAPNASLYGGWYSWSSPYQYVTGKGVYGFFASMTNELPKIDTTDCACGHSIGQIWAIDDSDSRGYSTVEAGWSVSRGQFGDTYPHLFVYHFDAGTGMGYAPGGGWVQTSSTYYPNMRVTFTDGNHSYGVQKSGTNWWVYYNNQWIGYYPASAYPRHFPNNLTRVMAGGEVSGTKQYTCTDMGKGILGSSIYAAGVSQMWYYLPGGAIANANVFPYNSDPANYTSGNMNASVGSFRYGGPGWC